MRGASWGGLAAFALAACVLARLAPPRAAQAHGVSVSRSVTLGMVQGVRERVEITLTQQGPAFRVFDVATGALLADHLTQAQLAARFPHLDPAGDVAAPVLMYADEQDQAIGW